MEIVRGGSLKTGEDYDRAAFLFQHGETPADYLLAHILAVAAVSLGHNSTWISAATLDRYLNSAGKTQVFGTQLGADVAVDGELITESLRQLYCVPSLKDREKINQALAKKLPLPRITPCVPKADAFQSKWEMLRKMPDGSVRKGVLNLGAMTLIEEGKKTDLKSFTAGDRQLTIATASEEFRFQVRGDVMEGTFRVNTGATGAVVALR
ncbi:MAG: hypothetical protein HYZ37_12340 [Candidatus Solibacter usitatus]|nr:hypothetical protein [Candidatus Solibacter usitatus]